MILWLFSAIWFWQVNLLNVISGLERPDSGKVFYDGKDITALSDNELTSFRKENVGFIFSAVLFATQYER